MSEIRIFRGYMEYKSPKIVNKYYRNCRRVVWLRSCELYLAIRLLNETTEINSKDYK